MEDEELCLRVVREILLARRWKFWEDIRFLLGSLSGSGVPVRDGGVFTLAPKVTAGIGAGRVTGSSLRMTGGLISEIGKVIGAEMGVGDCTGTSVVCVTS